MGDGAERGRKVRTPKKPAAEPTPAEFAHNYFALLTEDPTSSSLQLADYLEKFAVDEKLRAFGETLHVKLQGLAISERAPSPAKSADHENRDDEHKVAQRLWQAQSLCRMLVAYAPSIEDAVND